MIGYLQSQLHRMNSEQRGLVVRCAKIPEDKWIKIERERLTTLYMWLHMKPGSVEKRRF